MADATSQCRAGHHESSDERRRRGSFFTPAELCRPICEQVLGRLLVDLLATGRAGASSHVDAAIASLLRSDASARGERGFWTGSRVDRALSFMAQLRVCDPAAGDGAFLVAFAELLQRVANRLSSTRACSPFVLAADNFYGVEIDRRSVAACRRRLVSQLVGPQRTPPAMARQIRLGDALLETDAGPFAWQPWIARWSDRGGLDVLVGNPPFINMMVSDRRRGYREALRRRYDLARGAFDTCVPFCQLAVHLLRPGGVAGLILPNKLLAAEYAACLRQSLCDSVDLVAVVDASDTDCFDASVYPVGLVFRRVSQLPPLERVAIYRIERPEVSTQVRKTVEVTTAAWRRCGSRSWSPVLQSGHGDFARAFDARFCLGDVATVRQAATVDEAYRRIKPLVCDEAQAGKRSVRFLTTGLIDRYRHDWGNKPARYLGQTFARPMLRIDDGLLPAARAEQVRMPKLGLAGQALRPEAIWDARGELAFAIPSVLIYDGKLPLAYLCGLLNSSLYAELYRALWGHLAMRGGYLRFGPPQLRRLPLPEASQRKIDEMVELVEARVAVQAATRGEVDEIDRAIDVLACGLFGMKAISAKRQTGRRAGSSRGLRGT